MKLDTAVDYLLPVWAVAIFALCAWTRMWLVCVNLMVLFALVWWFRMMQ